MMEKSLKYLSDILSAISKIEDFKKETTQFSEYDNDLKTQSAVARQLMIVGEALNMLKKIVPEIQIEQDRQIIGFRNRLVHAYTNIDNAVVWAILKNHINPLKAEIEKKLK